MSCSTWGSSELAIHKYVTEMVEDLKKMRLVQLIKKAYPEKSYPEIIVQMLEEMSGGLKNG